MDGHSAANRAASNTGAILRDAILGGQDGLVNVMGLVLAIASATEDTRVVIIAGLAALFAESISMAAVAYTSQKASKEYYLKELAHKRRLIVESPSSQRAVLEVIYRRKGFSGKNLKEIVHAIASNKDVWVQELMTEELNLPAQDSVNPVSSGILVGCAAVVGSLVPIIPFFLFNVATAIWVSVVLSVLVLFTAGAVKTRFTVGDWFRSGLELAVVGTVSALLGYAVGKILAVAPLP